MIKDLRTTGGAKLHRASVQIRSFPCEARHGKLLSKVWLPLGGSQPKSLQAYATSYKEPQQVFKPLAFDSAGPGQVGLQLELTDILQDFLAHAKGPMSTECRQRRHSLSINRRRAVAGIFNRLELGEKSRVRTMVIDFSVGYHVIEIQGPFDGQPRLRTAIYLFAPRVLLDCSAHHVGSAVCRI